MSESTSIRFDLPEPTPVTLTIYDLLGHKVDLLVEMEQALPGAHSTIWNGTDELGRRVSSGVYFYRIETKGYSGTKALIHLH